MSDRSSRASTAYFLLGLSAFIIVVCALGGSIMSLQTGGGGFFPGLGRALGLVLIAAGNLLSWILNLISWWLVRLRWLAIVLVVQGVPAVIFSGLLGTLVVEELLEDKAVEQSSSIYQAIVADDVSAVQLALGRCATRCQELFSNQRGLVHAALHGSHQVARYLVDQGATPYRSGHGASEFYDARTSLYTCEGSYLSSVTALDLAVAREDMELLDLLWPVSEDDTRFAALRTAARLDRLGMVQWMTGTPVVPDSTSEGGTNIASYPQPLVRKDWRGERQTVLSAAASGAALEVGEWLLNVRPAALSDTDIQKAWEELFAFMADVDTPRSVVFGRLLVQHGANIHTVGTDEELSLQRAVRYRSKAMALQLLELGADANSLSEDEAIMLKTLLQKSAQPGTYHQNRDGCVAP